MYFLDIKTILLSWLSRDVLTCPGPRVPRFIVSPWTRGGNVFAETGDHTSDIMFLEAWAKANGYNMINNNITPWRRQHMTNMVNAFDFDSPDYSLPSLTSVRTPEPRNDTNWSGDLSLGSLTGPWVGPAKCTNGYSHGNYPAVPYGKPNAEENMDALVEEGFKKVRGSITEGRYITIESNGLGLARTKKGTVIALPATMAHEDAKQRWILQTADGNRFGNNFYVQSASDKLYIAKNGSLTAKQSDALVFIFEYKSAGSTYTLRANGAGSGKYISLSKSSKRGVKCRDVGQVNWSSDAGLFKVYGVNYHS